MPSPTLSLQQVQKLFPDMRISRELGQGSYKVVYEAESGRYQTKLALKILKENVDYNRLIREVSAMRMINSPYVAHLYEFQVLQLDNYNIPYMLEEYIEGEDLKQILARGTIYSPSDVVTFLAQVLQGLEACWEKRIVHRDIKPANIIIRTQRSPVIVDFGLTRLLDESSMTSSNFQGIIGTPLFAPPEVLQYSKHEIDSKTDLYALGVTAYIMLTGQHPYTDLQRADWQQLQTNQAKSPHEIDAKIPDQLSRYIMRLISRDRVNRPKDAFQARQRLPILES